MNLVIDPSAGAKALQLDAKSYIILGLPIRFLRSERRPEKYVWRCKVLFLKAPVAQPDRAPAF